MMNKENILFVIDIFKILPIDGKIVLNNFKILNLVIEKKLNSLIKVLKKLKIKIEETQKIWFIDIKKLLDNINLKIYYIPKESIEKLLLNRNIKKLPDPLNYLIGISFINQINTTKKKLITNNNEKFNEIKIKRLKSIVKKKKKSDKPNNSLLNTNKTKQKLVINKKKTNHSPNFRINKNKFILKN